MGKSSPLLPGLHHVTFFAKSDSAPFASKKSAGVMLELMLQSAECAGHRLHAACVMPDRADAIVGLYSERREHAMRALAQFYFDLFRHRLRFRARRLKDTPDVLNTLRIVHMMPVHAGLAEHPAEYGPTTYRAYVHGEKLRGLYRDMVLGIFGEGFDPRASFRAVVMEPPDELENRGDAEFIPMPLVRVLRDVAN